MILLSWIGEYISKGMMFSITRVVLILAIGIPLIILIRQVINRLIRNKLSPQSEQLITRIVYYTCVLILFVSVLNEFGFKLSALLGAAGVFGIAIGFASQTSVSNIISGIFLISEKPFQVGDTIQAGASVGEVQSIDLLSFKLRTAENSFVRVPNETMIKTEVINLTRYPQRRVNIKVRISYKDKLQEVLSILKEIAVDEPLALKEPEPVITIESFEDSGIRLLFGVWCKTEEVNSLRTALMIRIKETFDAKHIEIPFPHISLYAGKESEPIKITTKEL